MDNDLNMKEFKKNTVRKIGRRIENDDIDFPTSKYKCNKCGRESEWSIMIGLPLQKIPCGCGGLLILPKL